MLNVNTRIKKKKMIEVLRFKHCLLSQLLYFIKNNNCTLPD